MSAILDTPQVGSNYNFQDKLQRPSNPRSGFTLSHTNSLSFPVGSTGALIPILVHETVPTDSFDLSVNALLRVLPQVVPLYSKQKIFIHAFWCRAADLWQGFNTFMTKGYSGNRIIKKPTLSAALSSKFSSNETIKSGDLLHYLYSLPIGTKYSDCVGVVDALPLLMYLKVWRDYFMNKNFYLDDRVLLPDDDSEFRLNNQGEIISDSQHTLDLTEWRYRDFAPDRFTAAMPSPQRGDAPTLSFSLSGDISGSVGYVDDSGLFRSMILENLKNGSSSKRSGIGQFSFTDGLTGNVLPIFPDPSFDSTLALSYLTERDGSRTYSPGYGYSNFGDVFGDNAYHSIISKLAPDTGTFGSSITLNDFRQLAISQSELEKMARTDGSYSEFGLTFFGKSSKTAVDYRPVYVGGTYQPIIFSEVVQNSQSTDDSALGQYAGHGISSNNGSIGHLECDDYGWLMVLASVTPDTYYSQGLQKQFSRLYQADMFLPERAKLGAQPIYQKEIYFTGDITEDNKLFAYQDIFDELRYIENGVHGKLADPSEESFFPYTQSRHFESAPTFSQSFASMKNNVRVDYLTAFEEVPYTADFTFSIRSARPLPYQAIPAKII